MIPKKIHYCWFGRGEKPELALRCIESWKKYCPDYEIIEWNEENFDVSSNAYVKEAYEARKFAFVSDYVRLYAICTEGGIYMDTDVRVLKSLDEYLVHKAFTGFESRLHPVTGIMACEKANPIMASLLSYYDNRHFLLPDGSYDVTTNTVTITKEFTKIGVILNDEYQEIDGLAIYPQNVFCPDLSKINDEEYKKGITTIHYFSGSWKSEATKKREASWWWKSLAFISVNTEKILGKPYSAFKNKVKKIIIKNCD